tara:strand:+ start:313 stop:1818 length:1506 start_codon:yes stop_codon:yes gene_type:complete
MKLKQIKSLKAVSIVLFALSSSIAYADDGCTNSNGDVLVGCKLVNTIAAKIQADPAKFQAAFSTAKDGGKTNYSAYSLKPGSISYPDNNFLSTPIVLNDKTTVTNPIAGATSAIGECFPATYALDVTSALTVSNGQTFTTNESLTTDTTVKVTSNYAGVGMEATTEIATNNSKSSNVATQTIAMATVAAGLTDTITCDNAKEPFFVAMAGDVDQVEWVNANDPTSHDIPYTYSLFPHYNNYYQQARFTATMQKAENIKPGAAITVSFLKENQSEMVKYYKNSTASGSCNSWGNCEGYYVYGGNDPASPFMNNVSKGGDKVPYYFRVDCPSATASVRFKNDKGNWYDVTVLCGTDVRQPDNWRSGMRGVEMKNWTQSADSPADEQTLTNILVSGIMSQAESSYPMSGIYNATGMANLTMSVAPDKASFTDVYTKGLLGGKATINKQCPGFANLDPQQAQAKWKKDYCSAGKTHATNQAKLPKTVNKKLVVKRINEKGSKNAR